MPPVPLSQTTLLPALPVCLLVDVKRKKALRSIGAFIRCSELGFNPENAEAYKGFGFCLCCNIDKHTLHHILDFAQSISYAVHKHIISDALNNASKLFMRLCSLWRIYNSYCGSGAPAYSGTMVVGVLMHNRSMLQACSS